MTQQTGPNKRLPRVVCAWDPEIGGDFLGGIPRASELIMVPQEARAIADALVDADAYLACLHVRLDREMIEGATRLKVVATPTTGLDHLDLQALTERGIELISVKTEYELLDRVTSTAELAWGLVLACVRRLPAASAAANQGNWARDRFRGHMLSGKTLGVLGVGRLGKMVVEYGKAFRMPVLGCDTKPLNIPGVQQVSLPELLAKSDVLSIHIHLTPENRNLIGAAEFGQMKKGMTLVNTSRGGIIDESAFLAALESGTVAFAGLDVIDGEWRTDLDQHPLIRYARTHDNLIIIPHVGGTTEESQQMVCEFTANKLADRLESIA
jgi:D-3-phosphoglycerate dehydrogenase / 2-oxoglutarate reductase